ncbi:A Disintegrin And Metalloproteinase With Thrombospondin Motifs 18 [Manis pentadactyla]|nr:A Disintegrin And Metalloproteinase With Thrombospondin Motifs 18 [Manis pentadactyla]
MKPDVLLFQIHILPGTVTAKNYEEGKLAGKPPPNSLSIAVLSSQKNTWVPYPSSEDLKRKRLSMEAEDFEYWTFQALTDQSTVPGAALLWQPGMQKPGEGMGSSMLEKHSSNCLLPGPKVR